MNIITGTHFLGHGCNRDLKCCGTGTGTYDSLRHNDSAREVAQVPVALASAWFTGKYDLGYYELKFSGSTGSFDSSLLSCGHFCERQGQLEAAQKHTGLRIGLGGPLQVSPSVRVAFDVSISESNSSQPLWSRCRCMWRVISHPNAGTRSAEKTKTDKHKLLS